MALQKTLLDRLKLLLTNRIPLAIPSGFNTPNGLPGLLADIGYWLGLRN